MIAPGDDNFTNYLCNRDNLCGGIAARRVGAISLYLQIVHDPAGTWSVRGLPRHPVAHLASLTESIDYARRECGEAPATIELMVNGFYAVIHQELGWPRRLVAPGDAPPPASLHADKADQPPPFGFRSWLKSWGRTT